MPLDQKEYDRVLATARAQLDEETWQKARQEGQAMTVEQTIAIALEDS